MTILVGYTGRPASRQALHVAMEEARRRGEALHLVHVLEHEPGESPTQVRREAQAADQAEQHLDAVRERLTEGGITTTTELQHSAHGRTGQVLLDAAQRLDASLIVLGIEPRSKLEKLILGSVARDVLLRADCPVLTVKAEPHDES